MRKSLAIFGAGTLAKLAHYYAINEMDLNVTCFVVDDNYKTTNKLLDLPVLTFSEYLDKFTLSNTNFFIAIGYSSMKLRADIYNKIINLGFETINIVSKSAFIATNVSLGSNNIIMPGTVIEPNVIINNNNVIWSNSTICHDTIVGNHNFVASNVTIGGEVKIGDRNFFGFSSTVLQQKRIASDILIGAKSLVVSNIEHLTHYQGIPARKIKNLSHELGVCVE